MRLLCRVGSLILLPCLFWACQSASPPTPAPTYTPYPTYTPVPAANALSSADVEALIWPTGPRDDVIPFEDAAAFMGEKITVEGTVIHTHNSGNAVFLNFSPDFEAFTAVIFPDDWSKFPAPPEDLFYGKYHCLRHIIHMQKLPHGGAAAPEF